MSEKNQKKTILWLRGAGAALFLLTAVLYGALAADCMKMFSEMNMTSGGYAMILLATVIFLYAGFFLQILIHESGHLVFGLLSGYRFSSFRIGNLIWIKNRHGIHLKRLSLAGTGGQCLMSPPDMAGGKIPFILYHLGGCIMNTVSAPIFLGGCILFKTGPFLSVFLLITSLVGFVCAFLNGIPIHFGSADNDGFNAISLGESLEALRSFWTQLKINEQSTNGVRIKDMPEEWFRVPSDEGMRNSMTAVMGVSAANRMMDAHKFDEAEQLIEHLLRMESGIAGLHRSLLICDRIYCELIKGSGQEWIDYMRDRQQKKFMQAMKNFPSVIRTEYVYALLFERDVESAEKIKKRFEEQVRSYPYESDVISEMELMRTAEQRFTGHYL